MAERQTFAAPSFIPYKAIEARHCARIPICLFRSGILSPGELILWASFANFALFDGECFPTIKALCKDTRLSKRSVNRHINTLIEKGFLRIISRSKSTSSHRSNSYELIQHPVFDPVVKTQPNSAILAQAECQNDTSSSVNLTSKRENIKNQKKTTTSWIECENKQSSNGKSEGGRGSSLSAEEQHYIELQVEFTEAQGRLRTTKRALEKRLIQMAEDRELDTSDYGELRAWKSSQFATSQFVVPNVRQNKEELHAQVEERNRLARNWWDSLESDHPAKLTDKPRLRDESNWIRHQFEKFTQQKEHDRA
ncbi:helix-turn-helix domain-containing protein [Pseudodesulfovibrio indicus]|uniref:helix-turn-helix domain-containing protein n=1 Tax=Pseudodesulfovibrio indicus TaxID=1716143 RepID=UPI00292D62D9|nr:helix-turn-helix domain-containing protein [Pseudodesulfovibrio indicus]